MTVIIDYGVGNLFSLLSSFAMIGEEAVVSSDPEVIRGAEKLLLPGVGAFSDAKRKLEESGLVPVIKECVKNGTPLLGICLGMQMLFDVSYEYGEHSGLGLLHGSVVPMKGVVPDSLMIPHIGWNSLIKKKDNPILKYVNEGDCVYFVHSYYVDVTDDSLVACTEYGMEITAVVSKGNVYGCQFHPEKSGKIGLSILKAFTEL